MSLAAGLLAPIPGQVTVEVIDGTNSKRITRRFDGPVLLLENSSRLAEAVEPYGTADGLAVGAAATRRVPQAEKVWGAAYLVEVRAVPKVDGTGRGNPELCLVEKVYEETPYTRDEATQTDAQGAILSADRTVVCAVGQSVPAAADGYARVLLGSSRDFGRMVYRVRDVRGDGVISKGFTEGSDGIIDETGSYTTMTEPTDPVPGAFESWIKTAEAGYWRVNYSGVAATQLPAPGRVRRTLDARADGSVAESVTEAGENPSCNPISTGTVIQVGMAEFTRQGGIVGRTKHWLKIPTDREQAAQVGWRKPGRVEVAGTIGSGGSAFVRVVPGVERLYAGTRTYNYGTSLAVELPWQPEAWATWTVGGVLAQPDGSTVPVGDAGEAAGCLTAMSLATVGAGGKFNGLDIVTLTIDSYSDPTTAPTGSQITGGGDVRPYAASTAGVIYFERITERANVS